MIKDLWLWLWRAITSATFSDWANAIQIFTFVFGGAIYFQVSRIRWELTRRGRIGPLKEALNDHAVEIQILLRDIAISQNDIPVRLARSESTLQFVVKIIDRPHRRKFQALIKKLSKSRNQTVSEIQLWQIYAEIMHLVETLKQMEDEFKWQI